MSYILHYAPDNASLIVRAALELRGLPYTAQLVDRSTQEQTSAPYRMLNPNGLIPVLETPQGPIFETGAILLWLADTHGGMGPGPEDPARAGFLKWLFFISNTIHPALRMMFYPEKFIAADQTAALRSGLSKSLHQSFTTLDRAAPATPALFAGTSPTVLELYIAALLRWSALYPADHEKTWFALSNHPALYRLCIRFESLPLMQRLHITEGLGTHPFTNPHLPTLP